MILNETSQQDGINYELLNDARLANNLTIEKIALLADVPEPTTKNILTGKTKNPSVKNVAPIARVVGVPLEQVLGYTPKTIVENQALKEGDASVFALKEVYEFQIATIKESNEAHITNIRSHYEQHHDDLKENYERRLADKRELIDAYQAQVKDLKKRNKWLGVIVALFVIGVVYLLVMEFMHPEHGWLRW